MHIAQKILYAIHFCMVNRTAIDWNLAQSVLAVAEHGSLSAAARALGQSQPTIGRHVRALEAQLGLELFTRVPRGLVPTPAAVAILAGARQMAEAAAKLELAAAGQSADLAGSVRVTASVAMSHFVLPPILARLRQSHPEIQIELAPSDTTENLLFREADIAIRMYRPEQMDIVTRHVCDQQIGLYGATAYLDRVGRPASLDDTISLDVVGYDKSELIIQAMRTFGLNVGRDFFGMRCDDQAAYWHLVVAGCGIGAAQRAIGDAEPRVERVFEELALPSLPVWLAAPQALRVTPRIRCVWDFLSDALARQAAA